jgi:hypothetical protein
MKKISVLMILFSLVSPVAHAHKTAQEAAEASARSGLRHRGGNPSYEGLGCASTPERAYKSCCYANHTGLITYDVGYAQASNGLWVCCRRYVSKSQQHMISVYLKSAGIEEKKEEEKEENAERND